MTAAVGAPGLGPAHAARAAALDREPRGRAVAAAEGAGGRRKEAGRRGVLQDGQGQVAGAEAPDLEPDRRRRAPRVRGRLGARGLRERVHRPHRRGRDPGGRSCSGSGSRRTSSRCWASTTTTRTATSRTSSAGSARRASCTSRSTRWRTRRRWASRSRERRRGSSRSTRTSGSRSSRTGRSSTPTSRTSTIKALTGASIARNEFFSLSAKARDVANWKARASTSDYSMGERVALYLSFGIHIAADLSKHDFGPVNFVESPYVKARPPVEGHVPEVPGGARRVHEGEGRQPADRHLRADRARRLRERGRHQGLHARLPRVRLALHQAARDRERERGPREAGRGPAVEPRGQAGRPQPGPRDDDVAEDPGREGLSPRRHGRRPPQGPGEAARRRRDPARPGRPGAA